MREWSVAEEHHSYIVQVLIAETLVLLTIVFDTVPGVNDNAGRPTQLGHRVCYVPYLILLESFKTPKKHASGV